MMTATTDEQIVARAREGDREAFEEIVRRWERKIFVLACGMLGSAEDARDATQETFLAAYRNMQGFRGEASISSWLHRIAVNQCITRQRRTRVRAETAFGPEIESGEDAFPAAPERFSPQGSAERREMSEAVRRAVASLPPKLRDVVLMKEFGEMTFQEIADTLGVSVSAVKGRLYTALRQLRMRLARFDETEVVKR